MPRVSVVIPVYDSADSLSRAIDSVLSQTVEDLEVIVVDDASTDDPDEIVTRYEDPRVTFKAHERNKGGSAARNTGINYASGDYIAFLDADDEWRSAKLERQLSTLNSRSAEWKAVHCDRIYQRDKISQIGYRLARVVGTQEENPPKEGGRELIKDVFMRNLSTGASTLLVEADTVVDMGGFDERFPRHQDWEFLIRLLQRGKLAYLDEPLVTKHGSGRPEVELYVPAKELLYEKFDDEIHRLEAKGYPITSKQELHLTKLYLEDGHFLTGLRRLGAYEVRPANLLSIIWSLTLGIREHMI